MAKPNPYRGKGGRAYQRKQDALRRKCKALGIPCSVCGKPFDFANPNSARGFTADHPLALDNGGSLLGQQLVPMCRGCNGRKRNVVTPILRPAS